MDELKRLRSAHVAYECERILDALPLLRSYKEGKCGPGAAADLDYDGMKMTLFKQAFPVVDPTKTIFVDEKVEGEIHAQRVMQKDKKDTKDMYLWEDGAEEVRCINDNNFREFGE